MKRIHKRFQGLYWRQLFVTAGMVMLTLFLLGTSFFSLSYNYARSQQSDELLDRAEIMSRLSVDYLESGRYLNIEDLRNDPGFQQLASFGATVSDVQFMICDTEGHVLLSTDENLSGKVVTMPEEMTREILEEGSTSHRDDLDGLYEQKRMVVGVPVVNRDTDRTMGVVYAVSLSTSATPCGRDRGTLLHDGICGADDRLHGLLHHRHAAGPAHSGDGAGHAAVRRGRL